MWIPYGSLGAQLPAAPTGTAGGGAYGLRRNFWGRDNVQLVLNQSNASRRCLPMWLVGSDGTSPATGESGSTFFFYMGGVDYGSGGSLSATSAGAGHYSANFSASKISVLGQGAVYYRSATALPASTPFEVVTVDSNNSQDFGLAAFSVVTLAPGTHSNVTIKGIQNFANISSVTLNVGTHSGVTIDGVNRINSSVTIANALYSAVTVRMDPQAYSGLTVGVNNIAAGNYSGATVEVSNIGRSSMQSIADSFLRRGIAMGTDVGRTVRESLQVLRNRVLIAGSTMTVYSEDDVTSSWTASVSTSANASPIVGVDPGGP